MKNPVFIYCHNSLFLSVASQCTWRFTYAYMREVTELELAHVCLFSRQLTSKQVTFVTGLIERKENESCSRLFMKFLF